MSSAITLSIRLNNDQLHYFDYLSKLVAERKNEESDPIKKKKITPTSIAKEILIQSLDAPSEEVAERQTRLAFDQAIDKLNIQDSKFNALRTDIRLCVQTLLVLANIMDPDDAREWVLERFDA